MLYLSLCHGCPSSHYRFQMEPNPNSICTSHFLFLLNIASAVHGQWQVVWGVLWFCLVFVVIVVWLALFSFKWKSQAFPPDSLNQHLHLNTQSLGDWYQHLEALWSWTLSKEVCLKLLIKSWCWGGEILSICSDINDLKYMLYWYMHTYKRRADCMEPIFLQKAIPSVRS